MRRRDSCYRRRCLACKSSRAPGYPQCSATSRGLVNGNAIAIRYSGTYVSSYRWPRRPPPHHELEEDTRKPPKKMVEDIHAEEFELPEAFVSAFESADGSDARMKVVGQFFEGEEITLGQDDWVALKPNESHQVYLVGSSSLIHIERQEPDGTLYVVRPVQRKRGTIGKRALEGQVVSQLKKGRKLWLLTCKAASRLRRRVPPQEPAGDQDRVVQKDEGSASTPAIHPDEIVPETSSPKLSAVKDEGRHEEINLQAFDQLRTSLQNIRLEFWQGKFRSQPTEAISLAAKKAEDNDISGAIQAIEMTENIFARLIEQWEQDFKQAERKTRRGGAKGGDPNRFKNFKGHHLDMRSRISQTKATFRITLNWLREREMQQKREKQGH